MGYLGATCAVSFAELGYEVLGFDIDEPRIAKLAAGEVPFHEPGLDELLRRNLAAGRLRFRPTWPRRPTTVTFISFALVRRSARTG